MGPGASLLVQVVPMLLDTAALHTQCMDTAWTQISTYPVHCRYQSTSSICTLCVYLNHHLCVGPPLPGFDDIVYGVKLIWA